MGINNSALIDSILCKANTVILESKSKKINQKNTIHFNYLDNDAFYKLKNINYKNLNNLINSFQDQKNVKNIETKKFIKNFIYGNEKPSKLIYNIIKKNL